MSIIFKTFRTYAHPYVYDRHTNAVVMLTEDEYKELVAVEKGALAAENSTVINRYQEQGLFQPNVVQKIEHPSTLRMEPYLKTRMQQLTLQVTQQCNLRCAYCSYSGLYGKNRKHANERMSFDTAKKAIDYFVNHSSERMDIVIGFYGGEPLLEFELIKQCVAYARKLIEGKTLRFNMTTNGTLLTDAVVDYLVENSFMLSISLDGSKSEHDTNRKFADGRGSFDVIIGNLKRIRNRYPDYFKKIQIMTTINPYIDVGCVLEYFSTDEVFSDKSIIFNSMNQLGLGKDIKYEDKYYYIRNYEYIKFLLSMVGKLDEKYISPLVTRSREIVTRNQKYIKEHQGLKGIAHHSGPCLPGVRKLFVRVDGKLYPCERVNELEEYYCIGTLEDGVNIKQANKILNIGKLTENQCKNCWALRHCSLCAGQISFEMEPNEMNKLDICSESKYKVLFNIKELCVLSEFGLDVYEMGDV